MDFLLDLLQGAGIAAAIGIRPLLPLLLVGALAIGNVGIDFEGTDFAFLEGWLFLLAGFGVVLLLEVLERRSSPSAADRGPVYVASFVIAVGLGALQGAASLADRGHPVLPGIVLGAATAALGFLAARSLFSRARRRLDPEAQAALNVYGEAAALVVAGAAVLFPPLSLIVLGGLAWLLAGSRRREGEKYAGLRILR